jgi:hypothetical protein
MRFNVRLSCLFLLVSNLWVAQEPHLHEISLSLSPNPGCCVFSLIYRNDITRPTAVKVFDATGQQVYSRNYRNFNGEIRENIDLNGFARGLYFLQVASDREAETRRMILE